MLFVLIAYTLEFINNLLSIPPIFMKKKNMLFYTFYGINVIKLSQ